MTKKIDESQLIKDFREGKSYTEIALKQKCSIPVIIYRLKKLGLGRYKQFKESFSVEEKNFVRELMETNQGRKQLLNILKDE